MIHKESLCIMCGCCVSECNSMEADPEFLGPAALAKGMRFVGDPRDEATVERLQEYTNQHGIWDCTRCYFCQERCPKGVDPRDAIAKLGAEAIGTASTATWARSTRSGSSPPRRRPAGCARRSSSRRRRASSRSIKEMKFAMGLAGTARCRRRSRRTSRRTSTRRARSTTSSSSRAARARWGSCRARTRSRGSSSSRAARRRATHTATAGAKPTGGGRGGRSVAYYKGCLASLSAKELDISTQALAPKVGLELIELESVTCCGAGDIHEAEPDYYLHLNARILAYAEATGSDTLMTICNVCTLNLRQANFMLKGD